MLPGGGTYYTFVDSGAFTVQYATFTNMDENGVQLWNSGLFSINNSNFDYFGNGVISTSTLFTLNSVTQSTITLYGITYGKSRANTFNYNYTINGSSTGLQWTNLSYSGALSGAANTNSDLTQKHILWGAPFCNTITSVENGAWSEPDTWDVGVIPSSCNAVVIAAGTTVTADSGQMTASTTTINGTLQFSTVNSSTFTLVQGSMTVAAGGTLTLGTAASPIPE